MECTTRWTAQLLSSRGRVTRRNISTIRLQGQGSPDYGILMDGRFGHDIVNIDISAQQLAARQYPIYIGPVDLVHARLAHAEIAFGFVDRAARLRGVQVHMRESGWQSIDQDPR